MKFFKTISITQNYRSNVGNIIENSGSFALRSKKLMGINSKISEEYRKFNRSELISLLKLEFDGLLFAVVF
jgi:hypothetical protein